jgi:NTP pyrophosphatase (non-canonical NTP hydrolase)
MVGRLTLDQAIGVRIPTPEPIFFILEKNLLSISEIQKSVHKNSKDKGFWDASSDIPTKLMLIVTEVAEAMEDYRKERMATIYTGEDRKPEGFPTELADIVIRVMDLAEYLNIDLEGEIEDKARFNYLRPHMHGGKKV